MGGEMITMGNQTIKEDFKLKARNFTELLHKLREYSRVIRFNLPENKDHK